MDLTKVSPVVSAAGDFRGKPTYLKDHGHTVLNPAPADDDFDTAVRTAHAEYGRYQPQGLVGSSRE